MEFWATKGYKSMSENFHAWQLSLKCWDYMKCTHTNHLLIYGKNTILPPPPILFLMGMFLLLELWRTFPLIGLDNKIQTDLLSEEKSP